MYLTSELHNLSISDLEKELRDTIETYLKCKIEIKTSTRKDHHTLTNLKKYIARIYTIMTQKKEKK